MWGPCSWPPRWPGKNAPAWGPPRTYRSLVPVVVRLKVPAGAGRVTVPDGHVNRRVSPPVIELAVDTRVSHALVVGSKLISTAGGRMPAWERNGRELFYRDGTKAGFDGGLS